MAMLDSRVLGSILLVIGTSIGGALLVLPIVNASSGGFNSAIFLVLSWALMTFTGFLILEVNLWLPPGSNMISMARATLGRPGQILAWILYCLLLYTLLSGYTAGGADTLQSLVSFTGIKLAPWQAILIFTSLLGYVVYRGIRSVDIVNRGLMVIKLGIYFLILILIMPYFNLQKLSQGSLKHIPGAIMLMILSFGFGSIIPSLRTYLQDDIRKLRWVLIIGTVIPLVCYIAWDSVIMSVVPTPTLVAMNQSGHAAVDLISALNTFIHSEWITSGYRLFTSVCVLTAFLSVALSLVDFLADGLQLAKSGKQGIFLHALALLPPLFMVLFYPGVFLTAMTYAGIICVVLLVLMPILMTWSGRYIKCLKPHAYQVLGGKLSLVLAFAVTAILLIIAICQLS